MPKQSFKLDKDGPKRVGLSWKGIYKQLQVTLDGEPLGAPIDDLRKDVGPHRYALPQGLGELAVGYHKKNGAFDQPRVELSLNGRPLPGTGGDPRTAITLGAGVMWFIAVLNVVIGSLGVAGVAFFVHMGLGWPTLAVGAVFAVLAFLVQKQRSRVALLVGIILFAGDAILTLALSMDLAHGRVPMTGVVLRVLLLMPMIQAYSAIGRANKLDAEETAAEAF
ncbi:MAG: hypothetical protein EP329_10895 [Deltaproteobacteria bacterium]|nr:MAG: hypothetical protein EP329_10895 [Deltaproteobacteria bacterium]